MSDRLQEIKARWARYEIASEQANTYEGDDMNIEIRLDLECTRSQAAVFDNSYDIPWLIEQLEDSRAECERLEAENQTLRAYLNGLGIVTISGDNKANPYQQSGNP